MTYQAEIEKVQAPTWAELYTFTVAGNETFYTTHDESITHNFDVYLPRSIERSNLDNQDKIAPLRLTVKMPIDDTMAQAVAIAPVEPIEVRIVRLILPTLDEFEIFCGQIVDISIQDNFAQVTIESGTEIFKNEFPNFVWQARCQWSLFDVGCAIIEIDFEDLATVTLSVGGTVLTSAVFGTRTPPYYIGGHVRFETDIKLITNHVGNDITLQAPFTAALSDGKEVKAYPGCDKSRAVCIDPFDNFINFTGMANIPSRNPVIWGLEA